MRLLLAAVFLVLLCVGGRTAGGQTPTPAPACDRVRALGLVEQQAAEARDIDKPVPQISLMVRAAELLWPHKPDAARAAFAEAYELAAKYFRESGEENRVENDIVVMIPDQRFVVMSAIARRDPVWARQLAERTAEETRREADKPNRTGSATEEVSDKLLGLALSLLDVDRAVALGLARASFRHPASYTLPGFLLKLAETDRAAADLLFREAAAAYSNATAEELIYLAVYPFALNRVAGPVKLSTFYRLPPGFAPNPALQAPLVEAFLRRAERVARAQEQAPAAPSATPETAQLFAALTTLTPLVAQHLPQLSERLAVARAMAGTSMSDGSRERADGFMRQQRAEAEGEYGYERNVERAERETDPVKRDQAIAFAVMEAPDTEALERVTELAGKVSDETLREGLLDWLYFRRAQKAAKDGLFDEAARMAERLEVLDYRALLTLEIAAEALKRLDDRARAVELLDAVVKLAERAADTEPRARALLGVAHLQARLDPVRGVESAGAAVKTINRLAEPGFSSQWIQRAVKGKTFTIYTGYNVPGFSLENTFRELGARDFDGALDAARSIEYRPLRAAAVLALATECLEQKEKPPAPVANPTPGKERKPAKP